MAIKYLTRPAQTPGGRQILGKQQTKPAETKGGSASYSDYLRSKMRIGTGIGIVMLRSGPAATPDPIVGISTPAPGAEFVVGIAQSVSGTSTGIDGGRVEASFTPTFTAIVGTSGVIPAGGAWALNATAILGDVGSLLLYLREVGGTTARATLACSVMAMPWETSGNIGYWAVPPHGTLVDDGGGLISTVYDQQPASSYPVAKTVAYPLTSSGALRPTHSGGELLSATTGVLTLSSAAAELCDLFEGEDTPFTMMLVSRGHSDSASGHGWQVIGPGNVPRVTYDDYGTPADNIRTYRYDGTTQVSATGPRYSTGYTVYMLVFNAASDSKVSVYSSAGAIFEAKALNTGVFAGLTSFVWKFRHAGMKELSAWNRALTPAEITTEIERAATRWAIPLA
jgi:hypothetical protein